MKPLFSFFAASILLLSCNVSKSTFSDTASWVPPDFNPKKNILLIEDFPGSEKSKQGMLDYLAQNYPGKYEVMDRKAILNKTGRYADAEKYRFVFLWEKHYTDKTYAGSNFTYHDVDPNGHFYDRSSDKQYPTTKKYNNYGNKSYIPFFNSIIKYTGNQ